MRHHVTAAVIGLALCAAESSHSTSSGTDLVNLGTSGFSVDSSNTTAPYTQTASSLSLTASFSELISGMFAVPQNWSTYASFGLRMSTGNAGSPSLPFSVELFDSSSNVVAAFSSVTGNLSLTPSVVLLGRIEGGTGNFASVVGMQFTWDGDAKPANVNVTISDVIGFPPPTSGFFVARAPGGVRFLTSNENDVQLPPGGTAWGVMSDSNAKTEITAVNHRQVLAGLAALPVKQWSYVSAPSQRHIGPMAQDFHGAFRLGEDERRISTIDADGVALAALKGLIAELKEREQRSVEQARRLAELEEELADLVERLGAAGH